MTSSTTQATRTTKRRPTKRPTSTTMTTTTTLIWRVFFFHDARDIQNRTSRAVRTAAMEDRRFRELFGASIGVILHVWYAMEEGGLLLDKSRPKHLLWTLFFEGIPLQGRKMLRRWRRRGGTIDPKTLRKWVWLFNKRIAELADEVIVFESRFGAHDVGNDCLLSIDGTDFPITQKGPAFTSQKYAGKSALHYELGIILTGNLVWVSGPYPAGKWNDIIFFMNKLAHSCLEPGERVEADKGMWGTLIRSSAPTTTATRGRTSHCRLT